MTALSVSNPTDEGSNLGRKLVLHKVPFPSKENEEEDTFVLVTIVETKQVPGCWGRDKMHEGWRAEDESGLSYYVNWTTFDDASMTPAWSWHTQDKYGNPESWYDITQGLLEPIPFRPRFMERFKDVLHYCEKHRRLDYFERGPAYGRFAKEEGFSDPPACFDCLLKRPPVESPPRGWKGWR